jgi:hypothetical protein
MKRGIVFGAIALACWVPMTANAQATSGSRAAQAEVLEEQAWLLANQVREFETAAAYLRAASQLREERGARVRDLLNAGHYLHYANRLLSAVSAFQDAAEVAREGGDQDTAERALRNAVWIAAKAGDLATVRALSAQATPGAD